MINQEDKEIERLLIELGLAVFNAQSLEYSTVSLYAATELRGCDHSSTPQLRELMDTRYTHTLGRLVRDAALSLGLEDDLTQELQKGLQERNWLIHHFYREYAPAAFDSELRRRAISKIKSIRANLEKASQAVYDEAVNRILATGISQDELEVEIKQATERYIAEKLKEAT
jgi:hypothetical protein